jgi:hypothetical protein
MPRVDIFVRVRNDSGEDNGHATFSLEPQLVNELALHFTPERLAAYFGDLLRVQCMRVLYRVQNLPQNGISSVRSWGSAWEGMGGHAVEGVRDSLVQQLRDFASNLRYVDPNEQIPSNDQAFMREVEAVFQANSPFQEPPPSEVNEAAIDRGEFIAETPGQFIERLRGTVPSIAREAMSNGTIMDELFGVGQGPTPEEVQRALQAIQDRDQGSQEQGDQVRGRLQYGMIFDDAADFGMDTEFPISEIAIPRDPERRRAMREAFTNVLTQGRQSPSLNGRRRRPVRHQEDTQPTPETNEDRANIPTRYQRKPVI